MVEDDDLYHAAIFVFGYVYEFIFDKGIEVTVEATYLSDNTPWENGTFQSNKTVENVKTWLIQNTKQFR